MRQRLPPLNALRAFEASARALSFTRAAEELGVTQTAVSRHIRLLEAHLGVLLFVRLHNGLQLTDEGATYHETVRGAFEQIYSGTERLRNPTRSLSLRISVLPNFAMRWLIPRLQEFQTAHPKIEISLVTGQHIVEFSTGAFDVAIRFGTGWPGYETDLLFRADLFPVCNAAIAARLKRPHQLRTYTLLHVTGAPEDWPIWLAATGVDGVDSSRGPCFDSYALALQVAVEGLGVAMARGPFVADDLKSGKLVAPFALRVPQAAGWHLIYPKAIADDLPVRAFRGWILGAARRSRTELRQKA